MRKFMTISCLLISGYISFSACKEKNPPMESITKDINTLSPSAFYHSILPGLNNCKTDILRQQLADSIYSIAKSKKWIPIVFADTAVFMFNTSFTSPAVVQVFGDLNGWRDSNAPQVTLANYPNTTLYCGLYKAPSKTTRVDYKLVVNGTWILDPGNSKLAWSGYGPNSELALSEYVYSDWVNERASGEKGTLSGNIKIHSDSLNYDINYRVYLPAGYSASVKYPVVFVTDGQEYSDKNLGAMNIVADNMIMDNKIKPIIIVFVDPRDPVTSTNRRMDELVNNRKYTQFLSSELFQQIKTNYSILGTPDQTAILGTSLGGINSAYTGILRPDVFGLIAIQSPAFWYYPNILTLYSSAAKASLKVYMDAGTIYDTQDKAMEMKTILDSKGYPLHYAEYSEGHSWGNWRARIDDILIYFFQK
ncbi:MAG: alpha/beta hydrolase-fold protein [Paludibacter sp.]|nr:alpha/beta hydrolase-fold protein [Paludibacter sp.]